MDGSSTRLVSLKFALDYSMTRGFRLRIDRAME